MNDYIEELIDLFGEVLSVTILSPEREGFQNIDESFTRIEKKYTDILHSIVAKLIWVAKGVRTNIDTYISFLSTTLTKSTNEEKAKLSGVLQYLKQKIGDKSIMGVYRLNRL